MSDPDTQQSLLEEGQDKPDVKQAPMPTGKPIAGAETAGKKKTGFKKVTPQTGETSGETKEGTGSSPESTTETKETAPETQSQGSTPPEKEPKKTTKKANGEATKKKGRSLGKVTVYRSLPLDEHLFSLGLTEERMRGTNPEEPIPRYKDEILIPVVEPDEDPLIFPGVPEATIWVKNRLEKGELPSGDYFIIRLVKKFGATVKQVVQVNMQETDF